jgi:hypothetical protein
MNRHLHVIEKLAQQLRHSSDLVGFLTKMHHRRGEILDLFGIDYTREETLKFITDRMERENFEPSKVTNSLLSSEDLVRLQEGSWDSFYDLESLANSIISKPEHITTVLLIHFANLYYLHYGNN